MKAPTNIHELPEFWRRRRIAVYGAGSPACHSVCADELEAALAAMAPKQTDGGNGPHDVGFSVPDKKEIEEIVNRCWR